MKTTLLMAGAAFAALSAASFSASALDVDGSASKVSLISTKVLADGTSSVAEMFSFNSLGGQVAEDGTATVTIELGAIETGIDIRNERMGEYFFKTDQYPQAMITAQIPDGATDTGIRAIDLDIELDLHGNQASYTVPVVVFSDDSGVSVVASEPVLINANSFELQGGLGKLAELAGLMHIPATVPVTFSLAFTR